MYARWVGVSFYFKPMWIYWMLHVEGGLVFWKILYAIRVVALLK